MSLKLQAACLLIVIYYILLYIRETSGEHAMKCHPVFDKFLVVAPWAIIFDGLTAWSVNHQDTIPYWANLIFHALFFVSFEIMALLLSGYYTHVVLLGFRAHKKEYYFYIPGIIAIIITIATIGQIRFLEGEHTNYSMGLPVYIAFFTSVFYFVILCVMVIRRAKYIERSKRLSTELYVCFILAVTAVQIIFPETLLTSLLPAGSLIHIYENYEGANLRRLKAHNEEMVTAFATLVEKRDNSTGGHICRTKKYVEMIIKRMQKYPQYKALLTNDYMNQVIESAPMHDIGKIETPDSILQKPGKLTDEEYALMKEHAAHGGDIIKETFSGIDEPEFLKIAYDVARHHHEKWDGTGYPDGLAGEEIPLHARVMAIADVFDAVSSDRCYRPALPLDECFAIIENGKGSSFDPQLVDVFMSIKDDIQAGLSR